LTLMSKLGTAVVGYCEIVNFFGSF